MEARYRIALDKALSWVREHFKPIGIIVTGSIIRGNPNANSDLDIYVIHEDNYRQRIQKYFEGVPCEILVNNNDHILGYFEKEYKANRPVTAHMIATGKVVMGADNKSVQELITKANEFLVKKPVSNESTITQLKYSIATLFEDATDLKDTDPITGQYFLNKVVDKIIDFTFISNGIQLPRAKERIEQIVSKFPETGRLINDFYKSTNLADKHTLTKSLVSKTIGETGFFEWDSGKE